MVHEAFGDVRRALVNLVQFTHPRTPIVVHLAAQRGDETFEAMGALDFLEGRVFFNPDRLATGHGHGSILMGHVYNAAHGASLGLPFDYVVCSASNSRFFIPGIESYVVGGHFSKIQSADWLARNCEARPTGPKARGPELHKFFFDALLGGDAHASPNCTTGFSRHEGMFYPRVVSEKFLDFARTTRDAESGGTIEERILNFTKGYGGQAAEEVYLQSFVLNRLSDDFHRVRPPAFASPVCAHWPPRSGHVGALDVVAWRLGRNTSLEKSPYQLKRWLNDERNKDARQSTAFLECLGAADARVRTALGLDGDELRLIPDWYQQNNTLTCLYATRLDLRLAGVASRNSNPKAAEHREKSLLGAAGDTYPDIAALPAAVRTWLAHTPPGAP